MQKGLKKNLVTAAGLAGFFIAGIILVQWDYFRPLKNALQCRSVPTGILNYGFLGKKIKSVGLVQAVPNDFSRFSKNISRSLDPYSTIFQRKRLVTERLFAANPGGYAAFSSSRIMEKKKFKKEWPVISIAVNKKFLFDEETGILANFEERGRDWERLASVSYYEGGELLFATGVGLRHHGGSSRKLGRHFRLYFREDYGANQFKPGVLFSQEAEPIKRLVVHYDWPDETPFTNCLAFDIAARIGCDVPEVKPALLYFNGNARGIYFISEHVGRKQWESHLNHDRFLFRPYRGESDVETEEAFRLLEQWSRDPNVVMTLEEAEKYVNVDKLTRNLLSYAFCGTGDWNQGVAVLDKTEPVPRWFWVNWDMDRSFWFQNSEQWFENEGKSWKKPVMKLILNPLYTESRSVICRRLLEESPEYKDHFIRFFSNMLNHRLNDRFFQERIQYYNALAASYHKKFIKPVTQLKQFFNRRPQFIRQEMQKYFGLGPSFLCSVTGPGGIRFKVDGYPEENGYEGWYFRDFPITVVILDPPPKIFSHWRVNGKRVAGDRLQFVIQSETNITPIFLD